MNKIFRYCAVLILIGIFTVGCYKEQHFDMPGPYDKDVIVPDTLPFPFDTLRNKGIYLIEDGIPDHSQMIFNGYTDHIVCGDTTLWYQGDGGYTARVAKAHYALPDNSNHLGANANSYQSSRMWSRPMLEYGSEKSWYMYAKMSFPMLNKCASNFHLGQYAIGKNHVVGFDGSSGGVDSPVFWMQVSGQLIQLESMPLMLEVILPDRLFEVEIVCVGKAFYLKVDGKLIWYYNLPENAPEISHPIIYAPHRGGVTFVDLYIEGDIKEGFEFICDGAEGYKTIQAPALSKTDEGDVLLFAEARFNNLSVITDSLKSTESTRTNASDIIMKRSSDNGGTWSELTVVAGNKVESLFFPNAIQADAKTIVLYNKDNSGYRVAEEIDLMMTFSDDNAITWKPAEKLDVSLEGYTLQVAQGHGIKTSTGRLISVLKCVKSGVNTLASLYSDDNGLTWNIGNVLPGTNVSNIAFSTGANIIELEPGNLMMVISHDETATKKPKLSYSTDDGITWSIPVFSVIESADRGSSFQGAFAKNNNGDLYYFSPMIQKTGSFHAAPVCGEKLGFSKSIDGGQTWTVNEHLSDFAYYLNFVFRNGLMDAVTLDNGQVLCVTEGGMMYRDEGLVGFYK